MLGVNDCATTGLASTFDAPDAFRSHREEAVDGPVLKNQDTALCGWAVSCGTGPWKLCAEDS